MIGIYQILNKVNGKRYIGSSINIKNRLVEHKSKLSRGLHSNKHLQAAWDKYSESSFILSGIVECSKEDLLFYEDLIIKGYKANKREFGYNLREVAANNAGMMTSANSFKVGDTFYRLSLIEPLYQKYHNWWWLAQCSCGNTIEVNPCRVRSGRPKSCGCARKDILKDKRKVLVGLKFNRLTLLKELEIRGKYQRTVWLCLCDCGKEVEAILSDVRSGHTMSCGCYKKECMSLVGKSNTGKIKKVV